MRVRWAGLLSSLVSLVISVNGYCMPYDCPDGKGRCEYVKQACEVCPGFWTELDRVRDQAAGARAQCARAFPGDAGCRGDRHVWRRHMRKCQRQILTGIALELIDLLDYVVLEGCRVPVDAVAGAADLEQVLKLEECFLRESRVYCEPLRRLRRRIGGAVPKSIKRLSPGRLMSLIRNLEQGLRRGIDQRCRDLGDELDFCLFCGLAPGELLGLASRAAAQGGEWAAREAAVCPIPAEPPVPEATEPPILATPAPTRTPTPTPQEPIAPDPTPLETPLESETPTPYETEIPETPFETATPDSAG